MTYLELLLGFLIVGLFSFGGAYGAIPLIRDVVLAFGWLEEDALTDMIAVSESTPGPIMVNLATYVGSTQAGVPGAIVATTAVILPAFFIILLIMVLLRKVLNDPRVQAVLRGLKPCIIGIILADREIGEKEVNFIYGIGKSLGLSVQEISILFAGMVQRSFNPSLDAIS